MGDMEHLTGELFLGNILMIFVKKNLQYDRKLYYYYKMCLEKMQNCFSPCIQIHYIIHNDNTIFLANTSIERIINCPENNLLISCTGNITPNMIWNLYIKYKDNNINEMYKYLQRYINYSFILVDYSKTNNKNDNTIIAGGDQYGINKLYYTTNDETIIISSEMKKCGLARDMKIITPNYYIYNVSRDNFYMNKLSKATTLTTITEETRKNQQGQTAYNKDYVYIDGLATTIYQHIIDSLNLLDINMSSVIFLTGEFTDSIICGFLRQKYGPEYIINTCSIAEANTNEYTYIEGIVSYYNTTHYNYFISQNMYNHESIIQKIIYYCESYDYKTIRMGAYIYGLCCHLYENNLRDIILGFIDCKLDLLCGINKLLSQYFQLNAILPFMNCDIQENLKKVDPSILNSNGRITFIKNMFRYYPTINQQLLATNYIFSVPESFLKDIHKYTNMKYTIREVIAYSTEYIDSTPNTTEELLYREIYETYFNT